MARKRIKRRGTRGDGYTSYDAKRRRYRAVYAGRSKYFVDESSADAWRAAQKALANAPAPSARDQSLADALLEMIDGKHHHRPTSRRTHISLARTIISVIGNLPVGAITQADIARMDSANRKDLSASTCEAMLSMLHDLFHRLNALEILTRNPVDQYRTITPLKARGGKPAREPEPLAPSEVQRLLAAFDDDDLQPFFTWLCVIPFRVSELRGLTWNNVDTLKRVVHIRQQWHSHTHAFTPPKSKDGTRSLPIPARLFALTPREPSHLGLVFPNGNGNPQLDKTLRRRLDAALNRAELPYIHVHDLRHTAASGLLNSGCPPHYVQAFLGHAPDGITMHYARPSLEALRPHVEAWADTVLAEPQSKVVRLGA